MLTVRRPTRQDHALLSSPMRCLLLTAMCLLGACVPIERSDADTDGAEPRAVLFGNVDIDEHCDIVGAIEVILRARQVGCEQSPCTLPAEPETLDGDRYSCPATQDTAILGVEVDAGGRYVVEAVAILTTQEEEPQECFVAPGQAPPVLVTSDDVEASAHLMLQGTGNPCQ
jgi:hypothetical protein